MSSAVKATIRKLEQTGRATRQELVVLLGADPTGARELYRAAARRRAAAVGDEVHLRALIEFSNHCLRNCRYCGLRRDHRELERYRMDPDGIIALAAEAANLGYRTVVLQSGEDPWYSAEALADLVREIKAESDIAVTLSIGERPEAEYRALRAAGADRFLLRMETSDPSLYRSLHPGASWRRRLACLESLRRVGFQVGSGVLIGLPGQTLGMLADDLLFLQSLELDMIGCGPFVPHPATPLAGAAGGSLGLALRFLACLRLLCPQALIPATTALGALDPKGWELGLRAGADVLMPNVTPRRHRRSYDLYPGKGWSTLEGTELRAYAEAVVARVGLRVSAEHGHSRRLTAVQAVT